MLSGADDAQGKGKEMEEKKLLRLGDVNRRQFLKAAGVIGVGAAGAFGLAGCGSSGSGSAASASASASASAGATSASASASALAGADDFDPNDWDSVLEAAKGQTVNYHQSGSSTVMNEWLNTTVKEAIEKYGITWNYVPATGTVDVVNLVSSEMAAGKTEDGSVDFMWINGENFFSLKDHGYLYGSYLDYLPNLKYCDPDNPNLTVDCGVAIEGMESPFQATYDVFWADTANIPESDFPTTLAELKELIIAHPGRFTYAEPGNSNGTYFMGTVIAGLCGKETWNRINKEAIPHDELKELIEPALQWLRDINPYLWNNGATHPANGSEVIQLMGDGELDLEFSSTMPKSYIDAGTIPSTVKPFFVKDAVISDFWYLTIPANAAHKAAALVACNEIMEPYIQMTQFEKVGYYPFSPYELMTPEAQKMYDAIDWDAGLIPPDEMNPYIVPQANGQNNDTIEDLWHEEVYGK